MSDRYFHLRLHCTYKEPENTIQDLNVEVLNDNQWQALDLGIRSPGFLLFINGLFSCQHLYMRTNCTERHLVIESTEGELKIVTSENWDIKEAVITFNTRLKSGSPTEDDIQYITDRMKHCPVSTNLPVTINIKNSVHFDK